MEELEMLLNQIKNADLDAYREIIAYCESRATGVEGIPAIIGLDDLTNPDNSVYEGAKMDTEMNRKMAVDAMLFAWLYDQVPDRDPHYPAIAPAMSALAEKSFVIFDGDTEPSQYRDMVRRK